MQRRTILSFLLVVAALLALTAPALAGGWAVITVDTLPGEVHAGQTLHLGFMVRQHGVTPIDDDPWGNSTLKPVLTATKKGGSVAPVAASGSAESIRVEARKEGPKGHFVVDVTFPSDGAWDWEIAAAPFEGTRMEPMTVLPVLALSAQPLAAPATATSLSMPSFAPDSLRWLGVTLLIAAGGLAMLRRRDSFGRWLALRSR